MSDESGTIEALSDKVVALFPHAAKPADGAEPGRFRPLPAQMSGYTRRVMLGRNTLYWRTGNYNDGQLAKLEIDIVGEPPALRSVINAYAQAISAGLQHGVPLRTYLVPGRQAWLTEINVVADSPLEVVMNDLAGEYLGWPLPPAGQIDG